MVLKAQYSPTPIAPTPGAITQVANHYRGQLDTLYSAAARSQAYRYQIIMTRLGGEIDTLTNKIAARIAAGKDVPVSWLHKQGAYRTLIIQTRQEFDKFAKETGVEIADYSKQAVELAQQSAPAMIEAGLPGSTNLYGAFHNLPKNALEQLAGSFTDRAGVMSPLKTLMDRIGPIAAVVAEAEIADGITRGLHPDEIGKRLRDALQQTLYRGQLIARTEMYRSYREANRAVFHENADVIDKWVWCAHPGSRTCAACLAMDGEEFPTDEPMGSHPNCRCTCVPKTKTWAELGFPEIADVSVVPQKGRGEAALRAMTPAQQQAAFGNKKLWKGWNDGEYELRDVVRVTNKPDWGVNRTISGYDRAIENRNARLALERGGGTSGGGTKPKVIRSKRTWHEKTRDRIAQGVDTEADVREVGKMIRAELENVDKAGAKAYAKRKKVRDEEIAKLRQERRELSERRIELAAQPDFNFFEDSPGKREYDAIKKKQDKHRERIFELEDEDAKDLAESGDVAITPDRIRAKLKQVRPGYGEGDVSQYKFATGSHAKAKDTINRASSSLPKEWVDGFAPYEFQTKNVARGFFSQGGGHNGGIRVFLSGDGGDGSVSTAIHELTHFRERTGGIRFTDIEREFYKRRTEGETTRWMGPGYSRNEVARYDKFFEPYCGKDYGRNSYEVGTMGVQYLVSPGIPIPPSLLADTDYVDFILGMLAAL